jgi:ribonuclease HI
VDKGPLERSRALGYFRRVLHSPSDPWTLRCDGGSRGNPGPGALGYSLVDPTGREVEARGEMLGVVTNNVAEYRALIAGLESAARHGADPLRVCMDSELVVRQMTGAYRVKQAGLKTLHAEATRAAARLGSVQFVAVRREDNVRADQLVNQTLDRAPDMSSESPR